MGWRDFIVALGNLSRPIAVPTPGAPSPESAPVVVEPAPIPAPIPAPPKPTVIIFNDDTERFERCMRIVFKHEGGFVHHPRDPGSCTNMGITIATLRSWRRNQSLICQDVKDLTSSEAKQIYRAHYWNTSRCESLPAGVDLAVFDFAVNSGRKRAAQYLQRIAKVRQDGVIGPVTLRAVHAMNPEDVIEDLCDMRMRFLRGLDTFSTFGKGWTTRVDAVERESLLMAREVVG